MKKSNHVLIARIKISMLVIGFVTCIFSSGFTHAQDKQNATPLSDDILLDQYCEAKGTDCIRFDASNIKQFWISNSVISEKDQKSFSVFFPNRGSNSSYYECPLLPIQLMNVLAGQDCEITVIADKSNFSFSVYNDAKKALSESSDEQSFLHYAVKTSVFHLEDTKDFKFYLKFTSPAQEKLLIKKILLSFTRNPHGTYLFSPGILKVTKDNVSGALPQDATNQSNSIVAKGRNIFLSSKKKIYVTDNTLKNKVTIENTGNVPTAVYFGYALYTRDNKLIRLNSTPYRTDENAVFKILNAELNSKGIIIDSYPEWRKGCVLALNAKEDLSDFPNFNILDGAIEEIKAMDDGHSEVTLSKPVSVQIKPGTAARINNPNGGYLYTNYQNLQPGEKVSFSAEIKKDDSVFSITPKAICRNTLYIVPVILSNSINSTQENEIIVTDFEVSY